MAMVCTPSLLQGLDLYSLFHCLRMHSRVCSTNLQSCLGKQVSSQKLLCRSFHSSYWEVCPKVEQCGWKEAKSAEIQEEDAGPYCFYDKISDVQMAYTCRSWVTTAQVKVGTQVGVSVRNHGGTLLTGLCTEAELAFFHNQSTCQWMGLLRLGGALLH